MGQYQSGRNIKTLWALVLLGIAYNSWLYYQRTLTGTNKVDGIIGVLLGLFICSRPVANVLDMFFFGRGARRQFSSRWYALLWLALNTLVFLLGWFIIFVGTTRLVDLGKQ
jgi:hypothetical protein